MRLLLAAALLLPLAAGCVGPERTDEPPSGAECDLEPALCDPQAYLADHHCIRQDVRPRIYAPDTPGPDAAADPWQPGDYWTYRLSVDGKSQSSTLVYYDDIDLLGGKPQHYLVGTADRQEALEHALFSVNPMLGRIHRSLYSPHESGDHADMFHFPLCAGSTWETAFYGRTFQMQAEPATVKAAGKDDPAGFRLTGRAADGSTLALEYAPSVKWFSELELVRADGLEVSMVLTGTGGGKSGRYEFLRAQKDEVVDLAKVGPDGAVVERGEGGEGPYDLIGLHLAAERTAGEGRIEVHLRDPDGTSRACVGVAGSGPVGTTQCPRGPLTVEIPWAEGDWTVTVEKPLLDSTTKAGGEARLVSMYDRGGTV